MKNRIISILASFLLSIAVCLFILNERNLPDIVGKTLILFIGLHLILKSVVSIIEDVKEFRKTGKIDGIITIALGLLLIAFILFVEIQFINNAIIY
jgi:uncharacterized membrane protein HdeD (DUF308 family)